MARRPPAPVPRKTANLSPAAMKEAIPKLERRIRDLEAFDVSKAITYGNPPAEAVVQKIDDTLIEIFGSDSIEYQKYRITHLASAGVITGWGEGPSPREIVEQHREGVADARQQLVTIIEIFKEKIEDAEMQAVQDSALAQPVERPQASRPDPMDRIRKLCGRFHLVARQLQQRHANRDTLKIADEYDVQDLLHALLKIDFEDIRPEEWTPSYAGGSARVDFLMYAEQIVIEVKKSRPSLKTSELGGELIIDVARYKKHQSCKRLLCFVYDPDGLVSNPRGMESDLTREIDGLPVEVMVVPRGH